MTIRVYPAKYESDTNDYRCVICGWQGRPNAEGGWCPTSEIPCPECGLDVTVDEPEEIRSEVDLGSYFI